MLSLISCMFQSFCASFSWNAMPCSGCSALHGVNPNLKKHGISGSLWYVTCTYKFCEGVNTHCNSYLHHLKFDDQEPRIQFKTQGFLFHSDIMKNWKENTLMRVFFGVGEGGTGGNWPRIFFVGKANIVTHWNFETIKKIDTQGEILGNIDSCVLVC